MKALRQISDELKSFFLQREELIDGLLSALLCNQHVLLVGPPGAAKSMLADALCRRIRDAEYFQWLLTKFSTPEEIFGAISLKGLEEDRFVRVTNGKLPESHVAFLDEIFKANSSILNALLTLINERVFHNDGKPNSVPLITLVGASNELPEGEELAALYDRFLLRYIVDYIENDEEFLKLLKLSELEPGTVISFEDLKRMQGQAKMVTVPESAYTMLIDLRTRLKKEGIIASDRRFRQSIDLLKAHAYLHERDQIIEEDFSILAHVLWADPGEADLVRDCIFQVANPYEVKAKIYFQQATDVRERALKDWPSEEEQCRAGIEANTKLRKLYEKMDDLFDDARDEGRATENLYKMLKKIQGMQEEVVEKCLGLKLD